MTRIVQRLPTVLRCRKIDEFLGISERITTIRGLLGPNAGLLSSSSQSVSASSSSSRDRSTVSPSNNSLIPRSSFRRRDEVSSESIHPSTPNNEISIFTVEAADLLRDRQGGKGLDEDSLGRLEEDIKSMGVLLRMASPLDLSKPRLHGLLRSCTSRWPALRTTATLGVASTGGERDKAMYFSLLHILYKGIYMYLYTYMCIYR